MPSPAAARCRATRASTTQPPTGALDPAQVAAAFGDLPTLAPVAVELVRLADDDRASLEDIAAVLRRDPALAAQLLRVANSAVYGSRGTTTSLVRATSILGLRTVKLLSLTFSVLTNPTAGDPAAQLVWRHTLASSAMARTIAAARDPRLADECLIVGLLANLGRIALADDPRYLAGASAAGTLLDGCAEVDLVGCTSAEVSAAILRNWQMPDVLADAVLHAPDPAGAHGPAARIARVLRVASAAGHLILASDGAAGPALEGYRAAAGDLLDLTADEADALLVDAAPALEDIAAMFSADQPHDAPLEDILHRAKECLTRLTLNLATALTHEESRSTELAEQVERLAVEAGTDALTGLPNRRAYNTFLEQAAAAHIADNLPGGLGLIILDLDHFKQINDTFGHDVGDDVLRQVGARLAQHTRRAELAARLGGEEFMVVIPATYPDELPQAAERFRSLIAGTPFQTSAGAQHVTASVGGALLRQVDTAGARRIFKAADDALRAAKRAGRNRSITATI